MSAPGNLLVFALLMLDLKRLGEYVVNMAVYCPIRRVSRCSPR